MELTEAEKHYDSIVRERRWKGRATYGGGLDHTDAQHDWNRMAMEEALDLSQYLATQNLLLEQRLASATAEIEELKRMLHGVRE